MKPMISLAVTALFLATVTPIYAVGPYEPNEPGTVDTSWRRPVTLKVSSRPRRSPSRARWSSLPTT